MKTFNDFIEKQSISSKIEEIATLMAESQMDPNVVLKSWFDEKEPEISVYLTEAGFWDGLKQAGQAAWQGAKQGVQNFNRAYAGPEAHYNSAVNSLQKLSDYIAKDNYLSRNYSRFANNINGILSDLKANRGEVPINNNGTWASQNASSFSNVMNASQNAQQAPAQNNPQQVQAQQTAPQKTQQSQVNRNVQQPVSQKTQQSQVNRNVQQPNQQNGSNPWVSANAQQTPAQTNQQQVKMRPKTPEEMRDYAFRKAVNKT